MRVCLVVRQFYPSIGGLESFVASLAGALAALGCTCDVLTLDRQFANKQSRLQANDVVDRVKVTRVPMLGVRRYFLPRLPSRLLDRYDVIHVHGLDGFFENIGRRPRRPGQALIATTHGGIFHTKWLSAVKRAYFSLVLRPMADRYDHILANSRADADLMRGVATPISVLPNGVTPLGDFVATGRDLLYLGRLSSHKHIERLISAMAEPPLLRARLHIVGPGWDVKPADLERRSAMLSVSDRVLLHGLTEPRALAAIAQHCALFVSASTYEGFGMSLIEAMSVGLIPVVQANASFREIVPLSGLGALADFADSAGAAATLRSELDALSEAKRDAARVFAARYSWSAHAQETLGVYHRALRRVAPRNVRVIA